MPAGLGTLTAPLRAFADFLRIGAGLVAAEAEERLRALWERHARKPSFVDRLERAGLGR